MCVMAHHENFMCKAKWFSRRFSWSKQNAEQKIKELEEENRKLKQMYATLALDHQMAKEIIEKKL